MPILSLTTPLASSSFPFHHHHHHRARKLVVLSFTKIPSSLPPSPPGQLYQPFRPPSSPLPSKYLALDANQRLEILRDRLGLWHEYAPLISSLISAYGFSPPSIEHHTGISSIHQNRLSVASQVRDSLLQSSPHPDISFFDAAHGADLLYELRLLNIPQRAAAGRYIVDTNTNDAKLVQELARSMRDFPKRRGDDGWESFSADSPGDCLAYVHFRLSKEVLGIPDKLAELEKAIGVAESEEGRKRIGEEMEKASEEEADSSSDKCLPAVVRLRYGEVAEATSVVMLPVCKASEGVERVEEAPMVCKLGGELGLVVEAEKVWGRWVVLPGWSAVVGLGGEGGMAVEGLPMPWRVGRWEKEEEVIVVVDRKRKVVEEGDGDGFYLVARSDEKGELEVARGSEVEAMRVLGAVVLVVRSPAGGEDQLE